MKTKNIVVALIAAVILTSINASVAWSGESSELPRVTTAELKAMMDKKDQFVLINALSPLEFTQSKIEGSINVPFGKMKMGKSFLPEDKGTKLIFYCMGPK